jgi:hypothetical protein
MLTIVWNRHGFPLIDVFPNGSKFNARHSISHILSLLPEILAFVQDIARRLFVIRADNARPHCTKTLVCFWITIPYVEHVILLIAQIWLPQASDFSNL